MEFGFGRSVVIAKNQKIQLLNKIEEEGE